MAARKPDLILGTAGHIDHGKSSLILALTGTDPDRLAEEKKRGITITLGFAQLELPDGRTMGVVDVPGHEKFVKQMIAGSTGIDVALLTIAADDGIMPQTVEHIAVLQTLGVDSCVVALTKTDLVDDEWIEFMTGEIRTYLANTPYAQAPIIPVSSKTGFGLDALRNAIAQACHGMKPARQQHAMRLPIDRVFTIKGAGTVVTGTLWSGLARTDDEAELLPSGRTCRIRSVQIHDQPVESAPAGNRVALNLNGVKTDEVHPGDWIIAPGTVHETDRFDAHLTYLDTAGKGKPLESGTRMHIAHGTREVLGRVLLCDGIASLAPGQSAFAQIRLEEALPVCYLDRFVIRTYSPVQVAGGGVILLAHPRRRTTLKLQEKTLLDALLRRDDREAVETALQLQATPVSAEQLGESLNMDGAAARELLDDACSAKHAIRIGNGSFYTTQAAKQKAVAGIERALVEFHAGNPQATGIAKDTLRRRCMPRATPACFDAVLDEACKAGAAIVNGGEVGHPSASGAAQRAERDGAEALAGLLKTAGMAPPPLSDLAQQAGLPLPVARKAMALLERESRAYRISSKLYFDREVVDACKQAIADHLRAGGDGTAAGLRDVLGTSRKYALPLLEHFDSIGFTVRNGDVRTLRQR